MQESDFARPRCPKFGFNYIGRARIDRSAVQAATVRVRALPDKQLEVTVSMDGTNVLTWSGSEDSLSYDTECAPEDARKIVLWLSKPFELDSATVWQSK